MAIWNPSWLPPLLNIGERRRTQQLPWWPTQNGLDQGTLELESLSATRDKAPGSLAESRPVTDSHRQGRVTQSSVGYTYAITNSHSQRKVDLMY